MRKKIKNMTHTFIPDEIRLQLNKRNSYDGLAISEKSPSDNYTNDALTPFGGLSGISTPMNKAEAAKTRFPFTESPHVSPMNQKTKEEDLEISALKLDIGENTDPPVKSGHRRTGDIHMIETHLKNKKKEAKEVKVTGPIPKKPLIISSILLLISLVLLVAGTYLAVKSRSGADGLVCWILGGICGLPGVFYTVKFFRACATKCEIERQRAIDELPQE